MKDVIPYGKQNIDQYDIDAVVEVLQSRLITQGPRVEEFEKTIAAYCGVRYGVAFNSGTSALHGAIYAAGINPGDEVITSPITFVASANAAVYAGAKPVFADIDLKTYCIDLNELEKAISPQTRAIVPVDYAGYPVDIKGVREIADKHNLIIIEDAAHALGAQRNGELVGSEADMTMFSFHPVKHITTGEGGMIITDNKEYYDKLRHFRSHGIVRDKELMHRNDGPWYYEMQDLGYNYRITDIQCALGISQFKKLETFIAERNKIARNYDKLLKDIDWLTLPPAVDRGGQHAYHLYPVLLSKEIDRKQFFLYMREHNIGVQVHYIPVHLQPYYQNTFGYKPDEYPVAEAFYRHEISLPMFPGLSAFNQEYVVNTIKGYKKHI